MSMPEFPLPNPDMTSEQALNMLLSSIALEEVALSHIINAEGEKIQSVLGKQVGQNCPSSTAEILAINNSVTSLMEMVMQSQFLLKNKMEKVLEFLPKPQCTACSQAPCCSPSPLCSPPKLPICFEVIHGGYLCGCVLLWKDRCKRSCITVNPEDCSKIQVPCKEAFMVNITLGVCAPNLTGKTASLELRISSEEKTISNLFYCTISNSQIVLSGNAVIDMPCSSSSCFISVFVRSPSHVQINQGYLSFTRL